MIRRTNLLLVGLLALGACSAGTGGAPAPAASVPAEAKPTAQSKPAEPAVKVPGPESMEPETIARLPAPDFQTLKKKLIGLDSGAVSQLLGEPAFRRRDAPARVWQYRGARCVLDVFLYDEGAAARVRYVDLRSKEVSVPADTDCLIDILGKAKTSG